MSVLQSNSEREFIQLLDGEKKLICVDFYAEWCPPCLEILPKIEDLAQKFANVLFVKVDVSKDEDTFYKYSKEDKLPYFILLKDSLDFPIYTYQGKDIDVLGKKITELM